ncbi:MAG: DUF5683 domain-containing protein [Bacteroidales bacterium]|nr:DUF5683 domain-containing protein [Bacteroidales bacterium]
MKKIIRTYCLLVSILFASCLFPEAGANSTCAAVTDSIKDMKYPDTLVNKLPDTTTSISADTASVRIYKPDPQKAIWYSALCPGLGQLYNRRYWKLPIVGAGVMGIAYAIGWNGKYYTAYTNAYRDIADDNPNTDSYLDLLPKGYTGYNIAQLTTLVKNRQQTFRRYRDLSIIGAVGVYLICMIDAYVDAQLYDFDMSPDLSFRPQSVSPGLGGIKGFEVSLAFQF